MTENNNSNMPQPTRPVTRGAQKYDVLREMAKPQPKPGPPVGPREEVFSVTFIATKEKGVSMDENKFLVELIFKPNEGKLRLRPQETQLLLAYYSDLLKEITDEEQAIIDEENAKQQRGDGS